MVSKYIIGALLLGAASATSTPIEITKALVKNFEHPVHGKVNEFVKEEVKGIKKEIDLKKSSTDYFCNEKADHLCQFKHDDDVHIFCMNTKFGEKTWTDEKTFVFEFETGFFTDNKFIIDYYIKEHDKIEHLKCVKQEKLMDEKVLTALLAIKGNTKEKLADLNKEHKSKCVAVTEEKKQEEGDKKDKTELKFHYFSIDGEFELDEKTVEHEALKSKYKLLICNKEDKKITEAVEKLTKDAEGEKKCSSWWWLLVIPVVGGIGAGAYYALKEEDDEVSEYDCEA